ncbi:MAG TPA: hypothetical protein VIY66_09020 [Candidatus Acidoferrales bacterium]
MPSGSTWQHLPSRYSANIADYLPIPVSSTSQVSASPAPTVNWGPCLYLGPSGQRCARPALEGGFCAVHSPGSAAAITPNRKRVLAAVAAIIGILWPYVDDVVREIIRWMHSH